LDYEAEHGQSLFGFLRWFTATETTLKRDMDKAKGDVRLMTVHGAKGLEAKIVIMADATYVKKAKDSMPFVIEVPRDQIIGAGLPVWQVSGVSSVTPELQFWSDRHVKQLQEERLRLLYVAMTRAADELYICGTKNKKRVPEPAWWHPIVNALGEPQNDQPIRIGAADVEAISVEPHAPTAIRPAPWLFEIPAPEPTPRKQNPSRQNIEFNAAATKHGTALHRLLQDIADVPAERRFSVARQRAIALDLSEADASQMVSLISRDDVSIFFGKGSQSEVDIIGNLPEGIEISGRIDRITIQQDGIWLLDYKTNQAGPEPLSSIHPYVRQLAQYYALLKLAYPQLPVKAALLWTKTGLLEYLPEPLITAALQEIEQPVT
jgi:ATP-dependent helicase/nuclease subunit A